MKQLRRKVDHVSRSPAAKTVETLVHLHAGSPVLMEQAARQAIVSYGQTVILGSLPGSDGFLDRLKDVRGYHLR